MTLSDFGQEAAKACYTYKYKATHNIRVII